MGEEGAGKPACASARIDHGEISGFQVMYGMYVKVSVPKVRDKRLRLFIFLAASIPQSGS